MKPETNKTYKAGKAYVLPVGADPETTEWQEIGTVSADWEPKYPLAITPEEIRAVTFPRTVTYTFKMTKLEKRAFMRLFGIKVPSLIHNGKKRRR